MCFAQQTGRGSVFFSKYFVGGGVIRCLVAFEIFIILGF